MMNNKQIGYAKQIEAAYSMTAKQRFIFEQQANGMVDGNETDDQWRQVVMSVLKFMYRMTGYTGDWPLP